MDAPLDLRLVHLAPALEAPLYVALHGLLPVLRVAVEVAHLVELFPLLLAQPLLPCRFLRVSVLPLRAVLPQKVRLKRVHLPLMWVVVTKLFMDVAQLLRHPRKWPPTQNLLTPHLDALVDD